MGHQKTYSCLKFIVCIFIEVKKIVQTASGAHSVSYLIGIGGCILGTKRPSREAGQSSPSSAEFKNTLSCTSASPYVFKAEHIHNFYQDKLNPRFLDIAPTLLAVEENCQN
jgi:hypothetical protein